jgi:hypothetical protein
VKQFYHKKTTYQEYYGSKQGPIEKYDKIYFGNLAVIAQTLLDRRVKPQLKRVAKK